MWESLEKNESSFTPAKKTLIPQTMRAEKPYEYEDLALLFRVSQLLDRSIDLKQVVHPVLTAVAEQFSVVRGTITLHNREKNEILIEAAYGLSDQQMRKGKYRIGEGIIGRVVETGIPKIIPSVANEPAFLNRTGARDSTQEDLAFICVPIKIGNVSIGTFAVELHPQSTQLLDRKLQSLSIICSLIAQAVKVRQRVLEEREQLLKENSRLKRELEERYRPSKIIGNAATMQKVFDTIAISCQGDFPVAIIGEAGVGKNLTAHVLHYNSDRSPHPFVSVSSSSLPQSMIEVELFGRSSRSGKLQQAHRGTLFVDELGKLPDEVQNKLLRVIEEGSYEALDSSNSVRSNARIIVATRLSLDTLVRNNALSQSLLTHLSNHIIAIPPLRERKGDIPMLTNYFIDKYSEITHTPIRRITTPAINLLMNYHWPGNVRELESCIEYSVLNSNEEVIHLHDLPPTLQSAESSDTTLKESLTQAIQKHERSLILDALKSSRGSLPRAAKVLEITERMLRLRTIKHQINPKDFR